MRGRPFYLMALVTVLLALAPAGALAAEEPAAPAEAPAPEATPAPSTGWVPQDAAAEGAGSTNAPTQRGSSLGSGGSSNPAPSTSEPAPAPEPPAPAPAPADTYYEQETPTPTVTGEPTSPPEVDPSPAPAPRPEPAPKAKPDPAVPPAIGSADAVERPTSGVAGEFAASAAVEQVASTVTEDSGGLPWLALILCGLVLLYAGARVLLGPVEPAFFRSGRFHFVRRLFPGA